MHHTSEPEMQKPRKKRKSSGNKEDFFGEAWCSRAGGEGELITIWIPQLRKREGGGGHVWRLPKTDIRYFGKGTRGLKVKAPSSVERGEDRWEKRDRKKLNTERGCSKNGQIDQGSSGQVLLLQKKAPSERSEFHRQQGNQER